jgi:L-asparaginase II
VEPIRVEVRRSGVVEAVHRVHAVAVRGGEVIEAAGDPELVAFMRSSAKPLQAVPLARARDDLDEAELAIASASHLARPDQLEPVRSLLAKAAATEDDLECGPAGSPPSRLAHNCSGKHAGMLVLCRTRGWETRGYRLPEHPCQQAMLAEIAAAAELATDDIPTGTDGCGVVTFALTLERTARAFGRLEQLEGGPRVGAAVRARPELIRGPGAADTELMRALAGWTAKGGAEGLLCACGDGVGVVLKSEDGTQRGLAPAAASFLARLGLDVSGLATAPVLNSRGDRVGEVAV